MQDYALKVITETNESWAKLVKRNIGAGELSLVWDYAVAMLLHLLVVLFSACSAAEFLPLLNVI